MTRRLVACLTLSLLSACGGGGAPAGETLERFDGFVDLGWNARSGRLFLYVDEFDTPFIYQASMPRGVGSNDLGLDRGQLAATRVVRFERHGPRVLLVADNLDFRANSDNEDERQAIAESFARSVLWGFDVVAESGDSVTIDGTDFFLRDAHGLSAELSDLEEGDFSVDASRSAIYLPRTKAFPDNSEIEAVITYQGKPTGPHLPTVVPDPTAVTVHLRHSFIRLPDDGYKPMAYDPRAGVIGLSYGSAGYTDFATDIGDNLKINYGRRHRLEKKDPSAEVSEAVEPIVYYLDRGAPEPVRSALLDGARWWNEAFEAAGYKDAYRVEVLPEGADPMDVRYNVIQWVHRSTRGWSYGSSVLDPRTGEIIKGHVTLGSLRVRQDYMIAEGLLAPYVDDAMPDDMIEMSLARIRQLSAHEVGHTLGFEHNFASSAQDRASVMDYPHPLIRFDESGGIDLGDAYGVGIGEWDKRTVIYAYQDFPDGVDADAAREEIMAQTIAGGFAYVSDRDSRSVGSAHPDGNLWDNGEDAIEELEHLLAVRQHALERFSEQVLRDGRPLAKLEEVLVPIYLLHRFQLHAVGKLIGGRYFSYNLRGDGQPLPTDVSVDRQQQAIDALLATLEPEVLRLSNALVESIPPRPPGNPRTRETFVGATGVTFDPLAPAAASVSLTLEVLLHPDRAARMSRGGSPDFQSLVNALLRATWFRQPGPSFDYDELQRQTNLLVLDRLLRLAVDNTLDDDVQSVAMAAVDRIHQTAGRNVAPAMLAHMRLARFRIEQAWEDPASVAELPSVTPPPGSPIGGVEALLDATR